MNDTWRRFWPLAPIAAALLATTLLLLLVGADPGLTFGAMLEGSFGTTDRLLGTLAFWVPLLLCATGLLVTFTAGLWNIGVEGQMIMGSIAASWVALKVALAFPNLPIIAINYLISGPWQPPEGGTFRGTVPFPPQALLPLVGQSRFSPLSLILAGILFGLVALLLRDTLWGLKLRALGKNLRSAFLLGVSSERELVASMMFCGALAGLAGGVRVLSWFDSLRQSISGGIGFLAILIVLLAGMRPLWTLVIALLFSALLNGGTIVQLRTQLHSSLSGIIQGLLVLFVLLFGDASRVFRKGRAAPPPEVEPEMSQDSPSG